MTTERFALWLAQWLSRHPVKSPSASSGTTYTQEVMSRIEVASTSPTALRRARAWWPRPAWMLAMGGAVVAAAVLLMVSRPSPAPLARVEPAGEVHQLAQALSESGEDPTEVLADVDAGDAEEMAETLTAMDWLMLAEAPKATNALEAIWQELDALDKLDEAVETGSEPMDDDSSEKSSDELLEELEWIDSASSASS